MSEEELLKRIMNQLSGQPGQELAYFCNRNFYWNIEYIGDSIWEDRDVNAIKSVDVPDAKLTRQ